jgi:hypothetical protein
MGDRPWVPANSTVGERANTDADDVLHDDRGAQHEKFNGKSTPARPRGSDRGPSLALLRLLSPEFLTRHPWLR